MSGASSIAQSVLRPFGAEKVLELLSNQLSASELTSVLLAVFLGRAQKGSWSRIFEQYTRAAMFKPASADVLLHRLLDALCFIAAERFEAIELAPISPFGLNALAGIHQNNVLSALREAEVLADPTIVKALESARRRKQERDTPVRFAGSHRLLRLQPLPKIPGYSPHFRIFTLTTAGRDLGSERFEHAAIIEHVSVYLAFFEMLVEQGWTIADQKVLISDTHDRADTSRLEKEVLAPLAARFPDVRFAFDRTRTQGKNYYDGLCLKIEVTDREGITFAIGDGGFTTWTQKLLSDKKERFFSSAIGTELLVKRFYSGKT